MSTVMIPALLLLQLLFPFATPAAPQSHPIYGPAFSVDVAPTRPVMVQGGSTAFNIFIRSDEPASFRVRIEGVPPSVTAEIPHVGPGVSTIVLHCPPGTPTGTYAIQVTAAAGKNQQTQTFALDIKPLRPKQ
jgi:hypothetical protein